jgi:hypothetical protein
MRALALCLLLTACAPAAVPQAVPTGAPTAVLIEAPPQAPTEAPSVVLGAEAGDPPAGAESEFTTDFSRSLVPFSEILSGGPPKDGIPAIDQPVVVSSADAEGWLEDREPVVSVQVGEVARAYPIQILMWHEIVNDDLDGMPLTVTFCPLCNTAIAFDRRVGDRILDFGTTGRLRFSNLIMYDRQTESWWQQADGRAIVGELMGEQLVLYPAALVSWAEFKAAFPQGSVLSRETGFARDYGRNPYTGYDDIDQRPFLYVGPEISDRLPAMARVLTYVHNGDAVAYPYDVLVETRVANDEVGGQAVAVFWSPGAASALDTGPIAQGREVGSIALYAADLNGQVLTFVSAGQGIVDEQTGSVWTIFGQATDGPLAGQQLVALPGVNHFWFSWAAYQPQTRIFSTPE